MISNEANYIPFAILLGHAPAKRKEAVRMATTQMSLRMDEDVKRMMDSTASAIGITSATAMNIFARQFVAAGGFPFEVKAPKAAALPAIDRERLYRPQKTQDGSPVLPSEWLDPEGDVYDSLA